MKILYLANQRFPTEKAYGFQIGKMCEAFAEIGSEVELIVPRRGSQDRDVFDYYSIKNNFKVRMLPLPDFYFPGKLDKIAFVTKSFLSGSALTIKALFEGADLIYSRDEFLVYILSFFSKKTVLEVHKFSPRRNFFYQRLKNTGVKIIAISRGLKEEFIKFGFDPDNILVAHDGVDMEEFDIEENQQQCREKLGLPKDKKIIGYVGQLRTMGMEKGIPELIDAVLIVKRGHPDILLAIVGGSPEDVKYYENIAADKGMKENVIFFGHREHKEIPYFLRAFDVLAMPFPYNKHYAHYMSPLKLFEYMASGKPIVATDLPTVREVLNEKNSILAKSDDPGSLAVGIITLLKDDILAEKLGKRSFEDAKKFTWRARCEEIINFAARN